MHQVNINSSGVTKIDTYYKRQRTADKVTKAEADAYVNSVPSREKPKFFEHFTHSVDKYFFYYDNDYNRKHMIEHVVIVGGKFFFTWREDMFQFRIGFIKNVSRSN